MFVYTLDIIVSKISKMLQTTNKLTKIINKTLLCEETKILFKRIYTASQKFY